MAAEAEPSLRLKTLCFLAVKKYFRALAAQAAAVLPCDVLEELQLHLTVLQLHQIQPRLNSRGVSTLRGWRNVLKRICRRSSVQILPTEEEEAKVTVMKLLFDPVLYNVPSDSKLNLSSLDTPLILSAAAGHLDRFVLLNQPEVLRRLTTEWRSVLLQLERRVHSIRVSHSLDPSKPENQPALLVLHRLLDHGQAREVKFNHGRCPPTLAWILGTQGTQGTQGTLGTLGTQGTLGTRGSQASVSSADSNDDHEGPPSKQARLDLGLDLGPGCGLGRGEADSQDEGDCCGDPELSSACPHRHLESLELSQCQTNCLRVLSSALPSCSSLRSLNLHSLGPIPDSSAQDLVNALQQQSRCAGGGLLHLTVSTLPCPSLLERLLEACPRLLSLSAEVHSLPRLSTALRPLTSKNRQTECRLLKLRISLNQQLTPGFLMPSLTRLCPRLQALEVSGLRLQSEASYGRFMTTLSESCASLGRLILEDVNLSDSLEHVLLLLERCHFSALTLKDCRLLEKQPDKEECLKRLTTALANHRSLRSLSLAQNRIARHVPVLAQLFSPDSSLQSLDLSSNFIQAAELLDFSRRLGALRPNHRPNCKPKLDLRWNPGDRDPDSWRSAICSLAPHCELLLDRWSSTDTMVDHISNM